MDLARTYRPESDAFELPRLGQLRHDDLDGLEKVLRFTLRPSDPVELPARQQPSSGLTPRDISQALDLVHEAATAIRAAEERARDSEAQTKALLQDVMQELREAEARAEAAEATLKRTECRMQEADRRARTAEGRLQEAEDQLRQAESRVQEAEARSRDAEDWLRQIFAKLDEQAASHG